MTNHSTRRLLLASTAIASFAAVAMASAAEAQTSPSQDVVVTGSRIARKDYVADSPIVTVGTKQLEQSGAVTVEKLLNELPQFVPAATDTSNNPSNGGQANISLRGLGTVRTLVLVDGRRTTPSNASGVVDINTIPAALIDGIEVITGGASATYGSDAIAGVVNFKLKHHFTGLQIDTQYGKTDRNDGQTENVSILAGGNFAEDKGNAVFSLSYANRDSILNGARSFSAYSGGSGTYPFGAYTTIGTNLPTQAAVDAVFARYGVAAGTVKNTTTRISFNNDGTLFQNANNYKGPTTVDYQTIPAGVGAVATGNYNTGSLNDLQLPLTRYNAFARTEYDINGHIRAIGQATYTNYQAQQQLAPSPAASNPATGNTGFLVPVTNPFIPADLRTILASRPNANAPFLLSKRFSELGGRIETDEYNVYNLVAGLEGDIPGTNWTWNTYASYGRMQDSAVQTGNVSHQAVRTLLEAADGGASTCTGGYNPFGTQPISASCRAYISRTTKNLTTLDVRDVEANLAGGLYTLPAGEIRFAVGTDYRRQDFSFIPDSVLSTRDIKTNPTGNPATGNPANDPAFNQNAPGVVGFNAQNPLGGAIDVYELYGELLFPILKDLPFIKALNIDVAGRYSDYNTVGGVSTYKVDGDWKIGWGLGLRGGYSRAIRAPNIGELYAPQNQSFPTIGPATPGGLGSGDPCDVNNGYRKAAVAGSNPAAVRALCLAQGVPAGIIDAYTYSNSQVQSTTGGNPNLGQESASTFTIGGTWNSGFSMPLFHKLSASVDYYDIRIKNAVGTISAGTSISKCFNADGSNPTFSNANIYCQLFTRDPSTGQVANAIEQNANLGGTRTKGVDVQVDWSFGLGSIGLDDRNGSLSFNAVATYLKSYAVQNLPGAPYTEISGSIGGFGGALPKYKGLVSGTYTYGPVDLTVRWQYIDGQIDGSCVGVTGCLNPAVPTVNYFDLLAHWRINDTYELRVGVNNIGDKQPPVFVSSPQANTDPSTYDVLGRRYFVALRARF